MKRLAALVVFLAVGSVGLPQLATRDSSKYQITFDSVLQIVQTHGRDSSGVKALIWLGDYTSKKDVHSSFQYFHKALALSNSIHYQKKNALLYNQLGELHHEQGNYDSSLFFHRKALAIGLTGHNSHEASLAYQGISLDLLWKAEFDSAKYYLNEAQAISKKNKDYSALATIYNSWGNIFLQEGNSAEALKQYIQSAQLHDGLVNEPLGKATALANIGNMQCRLENFEKALNYTREAQTVAKKNNFEKVLAYTSQQLGRIYRKQKKLDEALAEYKNALSGYLQMGMRRNAAEIHQNIGNIYFDKSDFKEAENQYKTGIQLSKKISNEALLAILYHSIASVAHQVKHYEKALLYIDSARAISKMVNDQYTILECYDLLAQISKEQHKYKEALSYFQQFADLKDSLNEASNKTGIAELEIKYQNEKKATEIELLKSDQALKSLALSRQKVIITSIVIAFISAIAIAFLLINRYRVMNKAKRLVEIERVRNNIARDLHDDIGSTLSSINILSQVALMEKNGTAQSYLQRITDQSARIMEDMSDMVWSINPRNDSMSQVIIRMREFATEILELKNVEYNFIEKIDNGLTLTVDQRKNMFLIFKEVINNAAKYSKASLIEITFQEVNNTLILKIKDNGLGFDTKATTAGNGLRNLRERAKEINAIFALKSVPGYGTSVELQMPIA